MVFSAIDNVENEVFFLMQRHINYPDPLQVRRRPNPQLKALMIRNRYIGKEYMKILLSSQRKREHKMYCIELQY
jgi:hypothetical protein